MDIEETLESFHIAVLAGLISGATVSLYLIALNNPRFSEYSFLIILLITIFGLILYFIVRECIKRSKK